MRWLRTAVVSGGIGMVTGLVIPDQPRSAIVSVVLAVIAYCAVENAREPRP